MSFVFTLSDKIRKNNNNTTEKESIPQLYKAVLKGNEEKVKNLLSETQTLQNYSLPTNGYTPLHQALSFEAKINLDVVKMLISSGANLNAKDFNGMIPLHHAIEHDLNDVSLDLYETLIKSGSDVDAQDDDGATPLHLACGGNHLALKALLVNGADVNKKNHDGLDILTPLYEEMRCDDFDDPHRDYANCFEILENRVKMMIAAGIEVSDDLKDSCARIFDLLYHACTAEGCNNGRECHCDYLGAGDPDVQIFAKEVERMRDTKLLNSVSTFDVLHKSDEEIGELVKDKDFINNYHRSCGIKDFPIYHSMLQNQVKKGFAFLLRNNNVKKSNER